MLEYLTTLSASLSEVPVLSNILEFIKTLFDLNSSFASDLFSSELSSLGSEVLSSQLSSVGESMSERLSSDLGSLSSELDS